jgi:prolipoprotein diacylglyceryltransferase
MITFLPINRYYYLFGIPIPVWGAVFALGIIAFALIYWNNIKKYKLNTNYAVLMMLHFAFWTYIGIHFYHFIFASNSFPMAFKTINGNDSAGVMLGVIAIIIYLNLYKQPLLKYLDALIMPLLAAQTIIRIGCMLIGDELGKKQLVPWSIYYSGAWRHPIGLYYVIAGIVLIVIIYYLQKKKMKEGNLFFSGALLYCFTRFLVDFYRSSPPHVHFGMSVHQLAFGSFFIILLIVFLIHNKLNRKV